MKCSVCHHVYPDTLAKCSRCGRVAPQTVSHGEANSTLIEFPVGRTAEGSGRSEKASLPDWRIELNEKVREIKARRSLEARFEVASAARQKAAPAEPPPEEHSNPIVAAALNRVRRASENAARVAKSSAAPAMHSAPFRQIAQPVVASKVIALPTARTITPPEPPQVEPRLLPPSAAEPAALEVAAKQAFAVTPFDPAELLEGFDDDFDLVESEPAFPDVGRAPARVVVPAGILSRLASGVIDAAIVVVACIPFVAIVEIIDGDFSRPSVQALLGATALLIIGFYLFVLQALAGRTVGMVYSKTRVLSASSDEAPSPAAVLVRVLGYFVAALPAGLGFAWAFVDRDRRALHDILSRTRVVQDSGEA
jgi:uncharacterized RDD family membrane protein YckC